MNTLDHDATELTTSSIFDQAKWYSSQGFSVVPVAHETKRPAVDWKPYQSRIATEQELESWFGNGQDVGLGVVCGKVSGNLVCLDFDSADAFDSFAKNDAHSTLLDQSAIAQTSRGRHVFFRSPNAVPSTVMYLDGFTGKAGDLLAEGKFVVLPPTRHPEGAVRSWIRPLTKRLPTYWTDRLKLTSPPKSEGKSDMVGEGERHTAIIRLGGQLRDAGNDFHSILEALNLFNQQRCKPPLPASEVTAIATYLATKSASQHPNPLPFQGREDGGKDRKNILPDVDNQGNGTQGQTECAVHFTPGDEYMRERRDEPLDWLIEDIIPLTFLTVIGADSKVGKTCFATNMAHAVTHGTPFLGKPTRKSPVLWIAAEESEAERAMILCEYPDTSENLLITHDTVYIDRPQGIQDLRFWIRKTGAKLVIIDPLMAVIERPSTSAAKEGRDSLGPFKGLCREEKVAAVVLHHINKNSGAGMTRDRFLDSSQFLAVASVDWLMSVERSKDGVRDIRMKTAGRKVFSDRQLLIRSTSLTDYELIDDSLAHEAKSDAKAQIVAVLTDAPDGLTAVELGEKLNLNPKTAQNRLTYLLKTGVVSVVGRKGKASVYALPQCELVPAE